MLLRKKAGYQSNVCWLSSNYLSKEKKVSRNVKLFMQISSLASLHFISTYCMCFYYILYIQIQRSIFSWLQLSLQLTSSLSLNFLRRIRFCILFFLYVTKILQKERLCIDTNKNITTASHLHRYCSSTHLQATTTIKTVVEIINVHTRIQIY